MLTYEGARGGSSTASPHWAWGGSRWTPRQALLLAGGGARDGDLPSQGQLGDGRLRGALRRLPRGGGAPDRGVPDRRRPDAAAVPPRGRRPDHDQLSHPRGMRRRGPVQGGGGGATGRSAIPAPVRPHQHIRFRERTSAKEVQVLSDEGYGTAPPPGSACSPPSAGRWSRCTGNRGWRSLDRRRTEVGWGSRSTMEIVNNAPTLSPRRRRAGDRSCWGSPGTNGKTSARNSPREKRRRRPRHLRRGVRRGSGLVREVLAEARHRGRFLEGAHQARRPDGVRRLRDDPCLLPAGEPTRA